MSSLNPTVCFRHRVSMEKEENTNVAIAYLVCVYCIGVLVMVKLNNFSFFILIKNGRVLRGPM